MHFFPPLVHGTLREHYLMLAAFAGSVGLIAGFVGAWWGARRAVRSALREIEAANAEASKFGEIRALMTSVEAIGLEVERVGEAQRFVAKLLANRADAASTSPVRREPPYITPH